MKLAVIGKEITAFITPSAIDNFLTRLPDVIHREESFEGHIEICQGRGLDISSLTL